LYLLRDVTDWKTTLQFIEQLPPDIRGLPIVREQTALAQSKDGNNLSAIGALREPIRLSGDSSERRGLLGGRYKRLQAVATEANDKARYLDLDLAIREYDRGMKLDLNDYYPSSNLPRLYRLRNRSGDDDHARVAAAIAMVACERSLARNPDDEWAKSTLLGMSFEAGDVERHASLPKRCVGRARHRGSCRPGLAI
jgi:hypothetical protein